MSNEVHPAEAPRFLEAHAIDLSESLAVVLSLARDNMIDEDDIDMATQFDIQQSAVNQVTVFSEKLIQATEKLTDVDQSLAMSEVMNSVENLPYHLNHVLSLAQDNVIDASDRDMAEQLSIQQNAIDLVTAFMAELIPESECDDRFSFI